MNTYLNTTIPMNSCLATWQQKLEKLESEKKWDEAIAFMEKVIQKKPSKDAYIRMNFLLMNLLSIEDYNENKANHYAELTKKYFDESYAQYKDDPEYLFYTGLTAFMSEWFFGLDIPDARAMIDRAMALDPSNLLYQKTYYNELNLKDSKQRAEATPYAQLILQKNSPLKTELYKKGAIGRYIYRIMQNWAEEVITI